MRHDKDRGYRFIDRTKAGRKIEVIFDHIPGKRISTGKTTIEEAVIWAEEYLKNEGVAKKDMPLFQDFAKDFFTRTDRSSIHGRHVAFHKENRERWYPVSQKILDNYAIPRFGKYPLDSMNPVMIEDWIADQRGIKGEELSGSSKSKILTALSYVMDDAVRLGYIKANPVKMCMAPPKISEHPKRALTIWEQERLFPPTQEERVRVWGTVMWAVYFSVMYDTGFRPDEVAGLQLQDVYTTPGGMAVYTGHTMNCEQHRPLNRVKTSGKGMERRVGLLSDITQRLIERLVEEDQITDGEEYLFLVRRSQKTSWIFPDTANKHFRLVVGRELATEDRLSQYCLRHTYATMRRGSMDERVLAITMGHSNGVRSDYDHRDAAMVIGQLEKSRKDIFREMEEPDVVPLSKKIK